jgi:lysyl-tRNA synthetase class 2
MRISIDPQILKNYPGVAIGIIIVQECNNKESNTAAYAIFKQAQENLRKGLTKEALGAHPYIVAWHEAYKKFGTNPKKYLNSVENLAQRVIKGSTLHSINTLVDLYHAISLKYLMPIGGEDLDTIIGDIQLKTAGYDESPIIILGQQELYKASPGEVVYADQQGPICCRWNWREADRTKLTQDTRNASIVLDTLPPVSRTVLSDALNELASLIEQYAGGTVKVVILDEQSPSIDLEHATTLHKPEAIGTSAQSIYQLQQETCAPEDDETKVRIEKVEALRKQGIEPWPQAKEVTDTCADVVDQFETTPQKKEYKLAGRVMSIRIHGKTAFADIQDRSGNIQVYLRKDLLGDQAFEFFKHFIDLGDIIWVKGTAFRTKTGEITLEVSAFELLSKCLHPLPEKFHGLTDVEVRYRQRYLDLISNPDSREKFIRRTAIIKSLRSFLDDHEFLEVETPMLHPIAGGAAARPFITHHNALDSDFYLRIAPELYLKRLVVGGFERVYEINRNFRNEGVSTRHNPEFTMLEFYMAHKDYHFIMNFVEKLLRFVVEHSCNDLHVPFGEHIIDFSKPFKKLSVRNAVIEIGGIAETDLSENRIEATLQKYGIKLEQTNASLGQKIFALFEHLVETKLIQPTFIMDYPIEISPLAKRDPQNPAIAARYELFVGGMELSNGFNELNDPFDQAERFKQQVEAHKAGDTEAHQYDADYIRALEYGLPPTAGVGIGVDRLVMLLTNTTSIKDVILFPTLKKKEDVTTR